MSPVIIAESSTLIFLFIFIYSFKYKVEYYSKIAKILEKLSDKQKKIIILQSYFFNKPVLKIATELYKFINNGNNIDDYFNDPYILKLEESITINNYEKDLINPKYDICNLIGDLGEFLEKKENWPNYSPINWFYELKYKKTIKNLQIKTSELILKHKVKQKFKINKLKKLAEKLAENTLKNNIEDSFDIIDEMYNIGLNL